MLRVKLESQRIRDKAAQPALPLAKINVASKNQLLIIIGVKVPNDQFSQLVNKFSAAYLNRLKFRHDNKNLSMLAEMNSSLISLSKSEFRRRDIYYDAVF